MDSFNQAPQPKTFAPSREDILQTLAYFFGAPVSPEKLKNYEEHHAMTCKKATDLNTTHAASTVASHNATACVRLQTISPTPTTGRTRE